MQLKTYQSFADLRYTTFYLESIRNLPRDHPAIYEMLIKGYFVINESHRKFSGVSPDKKLEQTIQRAQESSSGNIGQTRWISYVSEREVVYHEILAISNTFRRPTNSTLGGSESELQHVLDSNYTKVFNAQVANITNFLIACGNPYLPESHHNCAILSQVYMLQKLPHSNSRNFTRTVLSCICHFRTNDLSRNQLTCQIQSKKLIYNSFRLTKRRRSLSNLVIPV